MDIFDFEELMAEALNVSDEQREDDDFLPNKFYEKFGIEFVLAFELMKTMILYTPQVEAGLSKKHFHAFISRKSPVMLMKVEAKT